MVIVQNNQDLSATSGIINVALLENIYHSFMDDAMVDLGRDVVFHLPPLVEQDTTTQAQPPPQQFNPFFQRVPVPAANTRNSGTKVTPRDVIYKAQIKVGPMLSSRFAKEARLTGMGYLNTNEAEITVVVEALEHAKIALAVSIEGRRYSIVETRPIGFSKRKYLIIMLRAIQETENPSPDKTVG